MSESDLEAQQASDGGETAGHGGAYGSKGVVGASSPLWRRPRRLPAAEEAELEGMPPEFYDEVCAHLCT